MKHTVLGLILFAALAGSHTQAMSPDQQKLTEYEIFKKLQLKINPMGSMWIEAILKKNVSILAINTTKEKAYKALCGPQKIVWLHDDLEGTVTIERPSFDKTWSVLLKRIGYTSCTWNLYINDILPNGSKYSVLLKTYYLEKDDHNVNKITIRHDGKVIVIKMNNDVCELITLGSKKEEDTLDKDVEMVDKKDEMQE